MVSKKSLINTGESFRRAPNRNVCIGLQLDKVEKLLCETSQEFCESSSFVIEIRQRFQGLAARKHFSNKELSHEELLEIGDTLIDIINDAPKLCPPLVANIHSTIGLVRLLLDEHESAIQSFVKALWIESTLPKPNFAEIGLTNHRIGIAQGRLGDFKQAASMLEKALSVYRSAGMNENHPLMVSALNELEGIHHKLTLAENDELKQYQRSSSVMTRTFKRQSWVECSQKCIK